MTDHAITADGRFDAQLERAKAFNENVLDIRSHEAQDQGMNTNPTYRNRVDALPDTRTNAIMAACANADDMGLTEDTDAYWAEVWGQVTA